MSDPCMRSTVLHRYSATVANPSAVSAQERANYSAMIDGILETSDLQTVTRKKIRAALEAKLGGTDLSAQKVSIEMSRPYERQPS